MVQDLWVRVQAEAEVWAEVWAEVGGDAGVTAYEDLCTNEKLKVNYSVRLKKHRE